MARPTKVVIDLAAIRHNHQLVKSIAPASKTLAIVKANAYGHGAAQVANALSDIAEGFGVACLEEAVILRDSGIQQRIVLLEGFFHPDELETIDALKIDVCIHSDYQLKHLLEHRFSHPINLWIKIDTGMHRLGIPPAHLQQTLDAIKDFGAANDVILMSHFACADETDRSYTTAQIRCFEKTAITGYPISLCNSPGVLAWPEAHHDWVRPGMMLYGASPLSLENGFSKQLVPAMTLQSEVIAIRDIHSGESVGYGATYRCEKNTRIATIPVGYGDGYPRHAPSGTPILVNGHKAVIAGRVSMDMITVDVTDLPDCSIGSMVECWGKDLLVKEVATHCNTIPYELVTRMTGRSPKEFILA